MNNLKYLVTLIVLILGMAYFIGFDSSTLDEKIVSSAINTKSKEAVKEKVKQKRKVSNTDYNLANNELFKKLKPPNDEELAYVWTDEYGCFNKTGDMSGKCQYDFLNAKSYKEALWMKVNGYPTKGMLDLIKNPDYKDQLDELVKKKYPVALTLASITAMERGDYREASYLALSNRAYTDKSMTYPNVLYGEALMKDGKSITGRTQLFIAGILGDHIANKRAIDLSENSISSTVALNHAYNYLGNVFGSQIPLNPRPKASDDI